MVDSACLFPVADEPDATCSLKDLSMALLGREMPMTHDSVNDARVALECLVVGCLERLERGEEVKPIKRSFSPRWRRGEKNTELFVHRIPMGCLMEQIEKMFVTHTHVQPVDVPEIDFNGKTGKVTGKVK